MMTYQEQCVKYFAPLDEIAEAIANDEGLMNFSFEELLCMIVANPELESDLFEMMETL
ncbi:MAG: hypothetical protein ABGX53_02535 [Candidatus Thioglobus sp.]|jgi:hypothetical protein